MPLKKKGTPQKIKIEVFSDCPEECSWTEKDFDQEKTLKVPAKKKLPKKD
jgi:hypothetical protein